MEIIVFRDVMECSLTVTNVSINLQPPSSEKTENGGSRFLRKVCIDLLDYMTSYPRRK
jgi:hypothetical protein